MEDKPKYVTGKCPHVNSFLEYAFKHQAKRIKEAAGKGECQA